jgi:PAS domain S-box-containing protein
MINKRKIVNKGKRKTIPDFFTSSIRRKISSGFTIVIVLVLFMLLISYFQLKNVKNSTEQIIPNSLQMNLNHDISLNISSLDSNIDRFFVIGGTQVQEDIFHDLENMTEHLESMKKQDNERAMPIIKELENIIAGLRKDILNAIETKTTKLTSREMNEKIISVYSKIKDTKQLHRELTTEILTQLNDTVKAQCSIINNIIYQFVILGILLFLLAISASLFLARIISKPIAELRDASNKVGEGKLDTQIQIKSKDEIGQLALSFNRMIENIRQSGKELQESEEKYRALVETMEEGIGIVDENENFVFVNQGAATIFGYSKEQLLGKNLKELTTLEEFQRVLKQTSISKTRKSGKYELTILKKDGEKRTILVTATPKFGNYEEYQGTLGIICDITEQKQAEEELKNKSAQIISDKEKIEELYKDSEENRKSLLSVLEDVVEKEKDLRESEGKYRLLAENTLDCIWKMDKDLKFTYINQSILPLLGFTREEWTGSKLAEHCSKKEMQHFMDIVEDELRKKDTYSAMFEMNLIHKDGRGIPLEILGKILLDKSNKVTGFQGNARDVTERIQAGRIQKTLYDISNALNTIESIHELFDKIRKFLNNIIDTTNFYVALYDEKTKMISLSYVVDEKDNISSFSAGKTLTDYVINTGKPLLATEKILKKLIRSGKVIIAGTPPKTWLGVPLKIGNKVTGVVAVHSYKDANLFSEKDMGILEFVSDEIARAIIRKQAEEELKESEESYRGLFNSATDAIYIQDKDGVFVDVNEGAVKMYGYPRELFIGKTPEFLSAPGQNDMKRVLKMIQKAFMGKPQRFEFYGLRKNGEVFPKDLQLNNGTYFGEQVVIAFARDITRRKQIERTQQALYNIANAVNTTKDLQELFDEIRKQLSSVIDTTNFFVAFYDEKTRALTLPYDKDEEDDFDSFPTGKSMTAYNIHYGKPLLATEELMNQLSKDGKIDNIGTMCKIWLGVPLKFEDKIIGLVVVQSYDDPELYNETDLEILSFVSDEIALAIEHKKAGDQIVNSLKEKEILLMEVHHRVKNNMQIISSLLKLQAGYVKDKEALELFKNSQNRVKSMSLIHEKIYRSKDLASVDFEDYVKSLSYNLFSTYGINTNKVHLELKVAKHSIDMNKAIPCGLIVNELLSNSLKHAFPKGKSGKVIVGLLINQNDEFELTVEDNGIGMKKEIDLDNLDSLGLQLIDALTSQLKGKISFESKNGLKTKLVFPS